MLRLALTLAAALLATPALASFQCRTQALTASAGPLPDATAADRAARRAWEGAAHHAFGQPYRWVLAEEVPGQSRTTLGPGGHTAHVQGHPCVVLPPGTVPDLPRGLPAVCAGRPDLAQARAAGCPFFYPLRR